MILIFGHLKWDLSTLTAMGQRCWSFCGALL